MQTTSVGSRSLTVALITAGCGLAIPASSALADAVTVNVFNFDFSTGLPSQLITDPTINVGDTIHWVFLANRHSTTSASGMSESWDSGVFTSIPASFDHTFTHTGVFQYYCSVHGFDAGNGTAGGMSGTITVIPAPGAAVVGLLGMSAMFRRRR